MKPYYEREGVTIYHADCRTILEECAADVAIVDPPYGTTDLDWDSEVDGWIPVLPVRTFWLFCSLRSLLKVSVTIPRSWSMAQDIVWEKHNGSNSRADRFRRVHEHAVQFYRGGWSDLYREVPRTMDAVARAVRRKHRPQHWGQIGQSAYLSDDGGPRLMRSVIRVASEHGRAEHPTQKPLGIVSPLIHYSCPPGGMVLDPFMGSGTTLVAAIRLGRRAIGIEIEERYCEVAAKRLAQSVMFTTAPPAPH